MTQPWAAVTLVRMRMHGHCRRVILLRRPGTGKRNSHVPAHHQQNCSVRLRLPNRLAFVNLAGPLKSEASEAAQMLQVS